MSTFTQFRSQSQTTSCVSWNRKKIRLEGTSGDDLVQPPAQRGANFKVKSGWFHYNLLKLSETEAATFQGRGTAAQMIKLENFDH